MTETFTATNAGGTYIAVLRAAELFPDHTYQRDLNEPWVTKRIHGFDPRLFGLLDVSDRGPNHTPRRYAIIDGQQRWALAIEASPLGEDVPLAARVHEGLTIPDEARLMHDLDRNRRSLTAWDRWRARRIAEDPTVHHIEELLDGHGLRFATSGAPATTTATSAAEKLYTTGGPGLLDATLSVLRGAWGDDPAAFHAPFLTAVAQLILRHGEHLDLDHLTDVLERTRPWDVRASAHGYKTNRLHDGSLPQLIAYAMLDRYNRAAPTSGRLRA